MLASVRKLGIAMEEGGNLDDARVRHLLIPTARREMVRRLAAQEMSQREIADALGVSQMTVSRDLSETNVSKAETFVSDEQVGGTPEVVERGCTIKDLNTAVNEGRKFGCIYADPPWLYDNQGTRAATSNHYNGLTIEQLCEMPVRNLAADDCHLHLWTTNGFLFDCPRIFASWGFEFRSSFIWVKPQMGIGNYWRNSHEILLTAIRGDAKRFNNHSLQSWIQCDRARHSAKPEQVRAMLERASAGPYLELFARSPAVGWTVWGNEVKPNLFHRMDAAE
jgi:N6-adenosine-specific RNA methylase IME4